MSEPYQCEYCGGAMGGHAKGCPVTEVAALREANRIMSESADEQTERARKWKDRAEKAEAENAALRDEVARLLSQWEQYVPMYNAALADAWSERDAFRAKLAELRAALDEAELFERYVQGFKDYRKSFKARAAQGGAK